MKKKLTLGIWVIFLCLSTKAFALDCDTLKQNFNQIKTQITDASLWLQLSTTTNDTALQKRELTLKHKLSSQGEKIVIKILSPADLQGIAILTKIDAERNIAQWMYLPQTLQTKRILNTQKQTQFAGSEFTFEDLLPFDLSSYSCVGAVNETPTTIKVLLKPEFSATSFTTLEAEFAKDSLQLLQIQYQNGNGEVTRIATFTDYRNITPTFKQPFHVTLNNLQRHRQSTLEILKFDTDTVLQDAEFNLKALSR